MQVLPVVAARTSDQFPCSAGAETDQQQSAAAPRSEGRDIAATVQAGPDREH